MNQRGVAIKATSFAAFRETAAARTIIDHRLTWQQRDDVGAVLVALGDELGSLRRNVHAAVVSDLSPLLVTVRDVEQASKWLDSMGRGQAANDTRTVLYAAALRLRQIVEV